MKTQAVTSLFLVISILALTLSFVSADRTVNYLVYSDTIQDNGTIIYGSTGVSGVNASLYTCATSGCTTVGSLVNRFYTNTNTLSIVFPETLQSQYGYVIYAFKPGYIGWEQSNVIRYGNGTVDSNAVFYMGKLLNGFAPIMNLSVTEETPTNRPIRITTNVSIDANTYSAIQRSTNSNVPLNEQVQTRVSLEISNSNGNVIYTDNQTVNIPYSSNVPVSFDYSGFSAIGQYTVKLYTDVIDAKIINSLRQQTSANIRAIDLNATNYTYTLIQNLQMTPALPRQYQNVDFTFNYLSGYVDALNVTQTANTILNITIFKDGSLISNSIIGAGSSGIYGFNRSFNEYGSYRVVVSGSPNDTRRSASYPSSQEMTFIINVATNNSGTINPGSNPGSTTTVSTVVNRGSTNDIAYESLPLIISNNSTITLGKSKQAEYPVWFAWILALTIILFIAVVLIYVFKFVLANEE